MPAGLPRVPIRLGQSLTGQMVVSERGWRSEIPSPHVRTNHLSEREPVTIHQSKTIYLSPSALAQRWSMSPGTLANYRTEGVGLPFTKIGRSVRYSLTDIEAAEAGELPRVLTVHAPVVGAA